MSGKKSHLHLRWNEVLVELSPDDVVSVYRNTRGNLNPGDEYEMTVEAAVKNRVWDTCRGTMELSVTWRGISTQRVGNRLFAHIDTGDQPAREYDVSGFGDRTIITA